VTGSTIIVWPVEPPSGTKILNRIRSAFRPDFPAYLRLDVKVSGALA
jgi:hypothetical protein